MQRLRLCVVIQLIAVSACIGRLAGTGDLRGQKDDTSVHDCVQVLRYFPSPTRQTVQQTGQQVRAIDYLVKQLHLWPQKGRRSLSAAGKQQQQLWKI